MHSHRATTHMPFQRAGALVALSALLLASQARAADDAAWASGYDTQSGTRFIPVELWTGAPWDGTRELRMRPADLRFGKRKTIRGPIAYTRPGSGTAILVYERSNGDKRQLFALSSRGDGLGRVYDSRYGRDCSDEVKMPLGLWKEAESRTFSVACNAGTLVRTIVVTIEKLDFSYFGQAHSLKFHWVVDGGHGQATDMHYTYTPGRGLVDVYGNE